MLPFDGKPVLEYNMQRAVDLDEVEEIILLVGHRAEDIINNFGISYKGKKISYVIQAEPKGLVNAIECAKVALDKDDFFLFLGDEILINSRHQEMVKKFKEKNLFAVCGVTLQKDKTKISRTYTVLTGENGRIFRLIEKPRRPLDNWQGTGHCVFKNEVLSYIDKTPIHHERGEKELPDLIQCAVDDGQVVEFFNICDKYTNINSSEDLEDAKIIAGETKSA
jgi:UDP-N-acetylglucosamine diphosphorylase / glucose-1-phosphate thymidylyltransferase / UDP-N-acetylgalactosamine diphosphorylase / glucosamine-1-phosphate N-acetyltransferase / galactosamine-1-phosphate N-acetyltransferase